MNYYMKLAPWTISWTTSRVLSKLLRPFHNCLQALYFAQKARNVLASGGDKILILGRSRSKSSRGA
jgi:hypothetical protein